jgi:hypothetical protein
MKNHDKWKLVFTGMLYLFGILFIISCGKPNDGKPDSESVKSPKVIAKYSTDGGPEIPAPEGASAKWLQSASGTIDVNGTSPAATIVITGANEFPCLAQVKILARFGSLREDLFDEEIEIGAKQQIVLPINLKQGLSMHAKQAKYVTRIKASVSFIYNDSKAFYRQKLLERYIALEEKIGIWLVMDGPSMLAAYPNGITNAEEFTRVQDILKSMPEKERQGQLIEPGVYADSADDDTAHD